MVFVKIEAYPHDAASTASEASSQRRAKTFSPQAPPSMPQPSQTFYASIASCAEDQSSVLSVGRKNGTIVFSTDKSVSRDHCAVQVVSTNPQLLKAYPKIVVAPRNDAESKACQTSPYCLVLEVSGKLGCSVVKKKTNPQHDADAADATKPVETDDDDATDDEDAIGSASLAAGSQLRTSQVGLVASGLATVTGVAPSAMTMRLFGSTDPVDVEVVGANQSTVLELPQSSTSPLVVQCGKMGSTLVLYNQQIKYATGRSGLGLKKTKANELLPLTVGAVPAPSIADATHFIVKARSANPQHVTAWSRSLPAVTPDYLVALSQRQDHTEALPDISAFEPKSDGHAFWYSTPNPRLWSMWTLLTLKPQDEEFEELVVAAGGRVLALYEHDDPVAVGVAAHKQSTDNNVFMVTTSKRRNKATQQLLDRLVERGIPTYTAKELTTNLANQKLPNGDDAPDEPVDTNTTSEKPGSSDIGDAKKRSVETEAAPLESSPRRATRSSPARAAKSTRGALDSCSGAKRSTRTTPDATKAVEEGSSAMEVNDADNEMQVEVSPKKTTGRKKATSQVRRSAKKRRVQHAEESEQQEERECNVPVTGGDKDGDIDLGAEAGRDQGRVSKERKAMSTRNGWFVAAPKGNRRNEYLRSLAEIEKATGYEQGELMNVAPTQICKGLVVSRDAVVSDDEEERPQTTTSTGPDFKAFRKNSVPRRLKYPQVDFRAVLPKESEIELELAEQRREVQEQQRRADQLFQEDTSTARRPANRRRQR